MVADVELAELRNQVLRKIGRNVVNFQKMEAMLKLLTSQKAVSGSLGDISRIVAEASKSVAKQPMGRLADEFVRSVYSSVEKDAHMPRDPAEISVSFSLRIEADARVMKERRRALSSVVAERNRLIHKWLGAFNPNSIQSCIELRDALDAQHARIWPEFEILKSIVQALKEHRDDFQRYFASDEFLAELQGRSSRA
jgi:hypothetical protein